MEFKMEQRVKVAVTDQLATGIIQALKTENYIRPMIAVDRFLLDNSLIQGLFYRLDQENIEYYLYDKIVADPPMNIINNGAALFKENQCDSILAIGGGSAIDTARGINLVRHLGGSIIDYVNEKPITKTCSGLIAVPTTSGTGSELSNALVVTDVKTGAKEAILSEYITSEYAFLCPKLITTLPKMMTISSGIDAFAHAAEGYTSQLSSPVMDAICEKVMYLIVKYLPSAVQNGENIEARTRMMTAAALAGWCLNNSGTHLGHSQAHIIGAKYHIPHGEACAYALPATLKYTATVESKKVKEIGYILGATFPETANDLEIGEITANAFREFRDTTLGLTTFDTWNISQKELLENCHAIVSERFACNAPMPVTEELVIALLKDFG